MAETKDVQVLKFAVRRDKVRYGPGQEAGSVIYDLPTEVADSLIAESNGTIVELPKREEVLQRRGAAGSKPPKPKKSELEQSAGTDGANVGELPSVDPSSTVK